MKDRYSESYSQLNAAQKAAVDHIEGPVMVLAGPGTGKTQLLGVRAGAILQKTDTSPESILCITFTDAAAQELRGRLHQLLGPAGARVTVYTFHSFGMDILNRYPEYFSTSRRDLTQLDDLGQYELIEELLSALPLRHPFSHRDEIGTFTSLGSVKAGIRAIKQAGLNVAELQDILEANQQAALDCEPLLRTLDIPRLSMKVLDGIEEEALKLYEANDHARHGFLDLRHTLGSSLIAAIEASRVIHKTGPVGKWKTTYTRRQGGHLVLTDVVKADEFRALIMLYEQYQAALSSRSLYDYEDMILWVVDALSRQEDLRLMIAEQYLYIMVDEYQDTNGAQNKLLQEISGITKGFEAPNVLVVGDDDQAIMRFQGAEVSNLLDFVTLFRPQIISLTDNYRSQQDILTASRHIITQTPDRLEVSLQELKISKVLSPQADKKTPIVERRSFRTRAEEFSWVVTSIQNAIKEGVDPRSIGVIAPKHAILENFAACMYAQSLPVAYDRRENILDDPLIMQLLTMAELVLALRNTRLADADPLWAKVLSYPFWDISATERARLALTAQKTRHTWLETLLDTPGTCADVAEFFLCVKDATEAESVETILDMLIGSCSVPRATLGFSPFKQYYFSQEKETADPETFVRLISHLSTLRTKVREHSGRRIVSLESFHDTIQLYSRSGIHIVDTNSLLTGPQAVQLMTAHSAKGREFETVFLINACEEAWGTASRGINYRAYVPPNLPIYPAGNTKDDKIRLLYVAMTRAKNCLFLTSHTTAETGKATTPLSFLDIEGEGWWTEKETAVEASVTTSDIVQADWRTAYDLPPSSLKEIVESRLQNFELSPTNLKNFLDVSHGGPSTFKLRDLLHFPEAKSFYECFGSAVHSALENSHHQLLLTQKPASIEEILEYFVQAIEREPLSLQDRHKATLHAHAILPTFYAVESKRMHPKDAVEKKLTAVVDGIRLKGTVDRLVDKGKGHYDIIDYKTGAPPEHGWQTTGIAPHKKIGLHFYRQQLLFYKLLAENSLIQGVQPIIDSVELRYVESNHDTGELVTLRVDTFDETELSDLRSLLSRVWSHIMNLDFPSTDSYKKDLAGVLAFAADLKK